MKNVPVHEPTLATVIETAILNFLGTVHTAIPGQIEKYDYTTAKADVKPLLSQSFTDGTTAEMPVISNVPVVWPRTSQGSISFPLVRGDGVLLIFSERSIDEWLSRGGTLAPSDQRQFDMSDAIAIPGLYSFASQTKISGNEDCEIHFKNQSVTIKANGDIEVGASSTQKLMTVSYKTDLETFLGLIKTCLDAIGTSTTPAQIIAAGAAFTTAFGIAFPSGFHPANGLTDKVKAQ
jgi:hypothetical protein